jgi:hypothetical protein
VVPELRVPVSRVEVEVALATAEPRTVTLFLPPEGAVGDLLEGPGDVFVPVEEDGRVRFLLRAAIASLTTHTTPPDREDDGLPRDRRQVVVRLAGGAGVEGELRWVRTSPHARTMDVLNQPSASFALHRADGSVVHVAKRHVVTVEEVPS